MALSQSVTVFGETASSASTISVDKDADYLKSVLNFLNDKYKGTLTDSQLMEGALGGLLNSLDPYTTFFTPQEAEDFYNSVGGTYSGVGISMELSNEYIIVSKIFAGSPAEQAGILQGDKIISVDGANMIGKTLEDVQTAIVGETGTKVKVGISRKGREETIYFEMTRSVIKINPITYEIKDGIGYIKLDSFNSNTDAGLTDALDKMDSAGITSIVFDLRDNPGGEVTQAVATAQKFVTTGVITTLDFKSEVYDDIVYSSSLVKSKYKLAVLVNGMSASASEIVAGAIQDTGAGTIIGSKSFGKAKVQGSIPLLSPEAYQKYKTQLGVGIIDANDLIYDYGITPLDSEIIGYGKMTLGLYYTPKGRMIDGVGIVPDISVADPKDINDISMNDVIKLTKTVKPGLNDQCTDIYNAERILKLLGYAVDKPDTLLDANTVEELKKFQKASGLYPYGGLDFTTQSTMNSALDRFILKNDQQYAKAVEILLTK